ncbi:MAG: Aureobasidin resistance protein Aur1 [Sclerophora amabilis]|nr:MAG: Aureobasidin resistance protein Aur1 [Sclerophora amabilis]
MKKPVMFPSWRDGGNATFTRAKLPFALPSIPTSIPVIIPHRIRRKLRSKLRSRQSPASSLTSLETSYSPADTLRSLRAHRWSPYDLQYLVLLVLGIFSASISEVLWPTVVTTLLAASLIFPITRQFFLPFLPVGCWLILFFSCRPGTPSFAESCIFARNRTIPEENRFIPAEYRPPIWVRILPALENIFYGANLSNILSAHKHVVLDVLAWIPYGLTHFGAPLVCSAIMFVFAAPGTVPVFARSFGYMNVIGVMIQLLFPCSPPWYENLYGLAPANYSMEGSPAGLARIDALLGFDMYTSGFTASPMVFGAFPSLHAGCATIEALFMSQVFPRLRPVFIVYTLWVWWATMYLSHHYAVDLVGGSLLAGVVFYVTRSKFLPRQQPDKDFRWDYDYTEAGDVPGGYSYGLDDFDPDFRDRGGAFESDERTVGSSSSISSGSISPVDESQSLWEGETLASHSDNDSYEVSKDGALR